MVGLRPKYYIETRFEKVVNFPDETREYKFPQPVEYCNGKSYWQYDKNSYERQKWGSIYWESKWFNDCLSISRYNEKIWTDLKARDKAFEKIYKNKSEGDGVYVPMKDFEIWLMCNGYEMISFDKMCSQSPCVKIVYKDKSAVGFLYTRYYQKEDKRIYFCFGLENDFIRFSFYFKHSDNFLAYYQVPITDFEKAERLELRSFQEITNDYL